MVEIHTTILARLSFRAEVVIPSGAPKARSRGIAIVMGRGPSTAMIAIPRLAASARNDSRLPPLGMTNPLGMTSLDTDRQQPVGHARPRTRGTQRSPEHLHPNHRRSRYPVRRMHSAPGPPIVDHAENEQKIGQEPRHHGHHHGRRRNWGQTRV